MGDSRRGGAVVVDRGIMRAQSNKPVHFLSAERYNNGRRSAKPPRRVARSQLGQRRNVSHAQQPPPVDVYYLVRVLSLRNDNGGDAAHGTASFESDR
jgi:hypothetical protein